MATTSPSSALALDLPASEPPRPTKRSRPLANPANLVEEHVAQAWPEIARAAPSDVWFTGSRVWGLLYPGLLYPDLVRDPPLERDWDVFTVGEAPARWLVNVLGWQQTPACRTRDKWGAGTRSVDAGHVPTLGEGGATGGRPTGYNDGYSYQTDRGVVDLWISSLGSAVAEIRAYPTESHAHCRAAWSFTDGLIVLPNERARALSMGVTRDERARRRRRLARRTRRGSPPTSAPDPPGGCTRPARTPSRRPPSADSSAASSARCWATRPRPTGTRGATSASRPAAASRSRSTDVIRSRAASRWYHAGTRDSDPPPRSSPASSREVDPETSWGEIVDLRDLERSAGGDMAPAGLAGVELARRALAGERSAVDAFASRRRARRAQDVADLESTSVLSTDDYAALTRLVAVLGPEPRRHVEDAIALVEGDRVDDPQETAREAIGQARRHARAQLARVSSIVDLLEGEIERAVRIALRRLARSLQERSGPP